MKRKNFSYVVKQIYKDTWLIDEHFSTMFVLKGSERALIIDCGTGVGNFLGEIKKLTSLPLSLALTHSHVDHAGGRGQFDKVYVSAEDAPYIKEVTAVLRRGYAKISGLTLGASFKNYKIERIKQEPEIIKIPNEYVFDLGSRTVKIIKTPGHTVGSVSYLDETNRVIFIGDIANEYLLMYLPHATTLQTLYNTHNRLIEMDAYDTVWSSHHLEPQTKNDLIVYRDGVKEAISKNTKNSFLPIVKTNCYKNAKLIYLSSKIR